MIRPALLSLIGATLLLSGCGDARRALGLEKSAPDEFSVVARAPLALPPDYSLRPPQPGSLRPQDRSPTQQARQTVFRAPNEEAQRQLASLQPSARGDYRSTGEAALLKQAGAGTTDPNIRALVNQESNALVEADRGLVDRILFWREPTPPGTLLDADKESQRLRENAALGKPLTDGDTPIIRRKSRGLLDRIF